LIFKVSLALIMLRMQKASLTTRQDTKGMG